MRIFSPKLVANPMRKLFKRFFLIDDTPHKIAAGAALGVFLGIAPGTGVTATVVLASVFRFNRLAAIAGVLSTNMWTLIFALPLAAAVGGYLFGENGTILTEKFIKAQTLGFNFLLSKEIFYDIVLPMSVGFVVVSGLIALLFYVLILSLMKMNKATHRRVFPITEHHTGYRIEISDHHKPL